MSERDALLQPSGGLQSLAKVAAAGAVYIALSASLIHMNKELMHEDRFPFSTALTCLHMFTSSLLSVAIFACSGGSRVLFPSVDVGLRQPKALLGKVSGLAVLFTTSIVLSNEAYRYCSIPFLQMMKLSSVVFVYSFGLAAGLEKVSTRQVAALGVVLVGSFLAVDGDLNFLWVGFACQLAATVSESARVVGQQVLLGGKDNLDPLTMVLVLSPLCLVTSAAACVVVWDPAIPERLGANGVLVVCNCLNAFLLNLAVAALLKYASAVAYNLFGIFKDIVIVYVAMLLFHVPVGWEQMGGFAVALFGIGLNAAVRTCRPECWMNSVLKPLGL